MEALADRQPRQFDARNFQLAAPRRRHPRRIRRGRDRPPARPRLRRRSRSGECRAREFRSARPVARRPDHQFVRRVCQIRTRSSPISSVRRDLARRGRRGSDRRRAAICRRRTGRGSAPQDLRPGPRRRGCWPCAAGHGAGSRTTKRAPTMVGSPSASPGPARFSAQIRPPWASTICLEIDRPSPEFWPKPWCGRSV